ncbi:DNA mismatch repair protein MutS [Gudongella oleilytica]|uniref:DNA mismatch repair protein MutS n=1 Tax=Gudongella oleilytica TaxID=1582259 RepID=UPI002A35856E|nr:DNA mismatch repair protein MutS [Gudongella oleilytica]MDY0255778.1 DNA mismatch repair protein MutS [Gudongella oleilytica]
MSQLTPMMQQYMAMKNQYKDSLLFFRMGDFYEMFFEDAKIASRELEIALTGRDCGLDEKAPMCGVPHHVAETYISRLVDKGHKVAVCEQMEDPALAKGLVKRQVTRIVTPGTIIDPGALDEKTNNFLASVYFDDYGAGISYVDNSTGEMFTTEFIGEIENSSRFLLDELGKIMPSEIICNKGLVDNKKIMSTIKVKIDPYINLVEDPSLNIDSSLKLIEEFFDGDPNVRTRLKGKVYSAISASRLIGYLKDTQFNRLEHIMELQHYEPQQYMLMDISTRTNLEIHETLRSRERKGALIGILDKTQTAMGGRLLKKWLEQPLLDRTQINSRLDMVEFFVDNPITLDDVREILREVYDIERLSSKIATGNCTARDMTALRQSISQLPQLKSILDSTELDNLQRLQEEMDPLDDLYKILNETIIDDPPLSVKEGGFIKSGSSQELDELRSSGSMGKEWLAQLEQKERQRTGIKTLKVGYNRVMGYYIDITKTNLSLVPDDYIRKQTLANSERYYTEELKRLEEKVVGAEEKAVQLEYEIFQELRDYIKKQLTRLQKTGKLLAVLDCIGGLAKVASANGFTRPKLNNRGVISIREGRHPVVEAVIEHQLFVPNDIEMDNRENMLHIITGPNMAGKSTFMRQTAIIVLLAQMGSFVPAKEADIGIVDRIFTRIGASDNLSQGESTFMVEMTEVSNILRYATKHSLLILDEVGRGTSTYDGLSIAWSVIEHIADHIKAKTLFATHYHELTQLESKARGIVNYTILAEERGEDVVFLRKVVRGSTSQSFGIQVARLAGIRREIIQRANEILSMIEGSHTFNLHKPVMKPNQKQLDLLDYKKDFFIDRVKNVEVNQLTPIEALNLLNSLVEDARNLKE